MSLNKEKNYCFEVFFQHVASCENKKASQEMLLVHQKMRSSYLDQNYGKH